MTRKQAPLWAVLAAAGVLLSGCSTVHDQQAANSAKPSTAAPAMGTQAHCPGRGTMGASTARWRHTSQSEIRGTTKPWA